MRLRILGSGTSTGVPEIGCTCPVCTSLDPRDNRLRTSVLVQVEHVTLLLDCGPDFRQQMLQVTLFSPIDAVLISHEHYDHVGGLDDLRPFSRFREIPVYANAYTAAHLKERMPYCFAERTYPGVPLVYLNVVEPAVLFEVGGVEITPVQVMHGKLPILGYRINHSFGYVTDMLTMPDESYELLKGVEILIINALRSQPHVTHQTIEEAIHAAQRIGAKETYLIHMSHQAGLHSEIEQTLPPHVHFAYDGMEKVF